jgi:proteasome lid subunit RPN8/RPN11
VRSQIYDHVFSNLEGEVGGVLVGNLIGSGEPPIIVGSIPASHAGESRASVTFTQDAWAEIHSVLEDKFPDARIVGWYHSHPGFGIFLSEHDLFIHRNFFGDPGQVAFVVDPFSGQEGTFGWHNGEVVKLHQCETGRAARRPTQPLVERSGYSVQRALAVLGIGFALGTAVYFAFVHDGGQTKVVKRVPSRSATRTNTRAGNSSRGAARGPSEGRLPSKTTAPLPPPASAGVQPGRRADQYLSPQGSTGGNVPRSHGPSGTASP